MAAFFSQASQFSIQGQTINFVAGDQNTRIHQVHPGDSDSIVSPGVLGTQSIFDDYEIIRRGNLRHLEEISKEVIDENDYYHYQRAHRLRVQKCLKFTRSAYHVQVIGQNLPRSVAVVYGGEDAQAAWERDLLLCSANHHPNIAHLFGLTRSAFSPGLVFYNDLLPMKQLWENGSAIVRCYIAHRIRKDIYPLESDDYFSLLVGPIISPDTGLFCISPIHSFQDGKVTQYFGWRDPKEPALSPLPVASYDDSYILSHYLKWARGDMAAELAFQKDISCSFPGPSLGHNPKQPVSLAVMITSTVPTTAIGKFKNLKYRVVDEEMSHLSSIQKTQDMFKTIDNEMEVTIRIRKWILGEDIVGQRNEPSSGTDFKGWTRIPYGQFCSYSTEKCSHSDQKWMQFCYTSVLIDGSSHDWLSTTWLSQAQYFCDTADDLYKDILERAALPSQVWFILEPNFKNHHTLLHLNYDKIFLFIASITIKASHSSRTSGIDVCWGNDDNNLYYWSFNPDGSCPLSKKATEVLGLPELIPKAWLWLEKFEDYQYEATKQFQLFRGYNPSTQEFAQRHGLPLVDIIWPEGKTGPDKNGDIWYDCQETQDENSDHLNEPIPPAQLSNPSYRFPTPRKIVKQLLDKNMCPECHSWPKFSVKPWLHGFLPDYEFNTWQGELFPRYSFSLKDRHSFCWSHCPDGDRAKPGGSRSGRHRGNSF
ncbi:hypothetical protein K435DRAFT_962266 [Dendrothele bispora CBS 962.96]|uniref:Protein kinase domain-containing protein n=1 Tax=Dendrothele bispora (strain CBS 962.96) TaxID=1314807 RepID=A0A4S8MLR7_DENBC|nr:hypothetical protein K435DRAFT_962266 [Dendrothele bispora CBS 962.96]